MALKNKRKEENINELVSSDYNYESLCPALTIENGKEYHRALDWALEKSGVNNIAICGPYGSGKSSVIESYFEKHKDIKVARISLAAFELNNLLEEYEKRNNKDDFLYNDDNQQREIDLSNRRFFSTDRLETAILRQLFYSVNGNTIPKSRYHKLHSEPKCINFLLSLLSLIVIGAFVIFLFPQKTHTFIDFLFSGPKYVGVISFILIILAYLIAFTIFFHWIKSNGDISEIHFSDKAILKTDVRSSSVFDKNMDEIMYFFEQTKIKVVLLEDLDRYENSNIFVALRDLNSTLNNSDQLGHNIKFIYALKDDLFEEEIERTKFFDFIIPVIPYISSTNSAEILLRLFSIDNASDNSSIHDISREFVNQISPFISDMRVLLNIYNEFIVYKNTLSQNQKLKLYDKNIFSMMVFKNLYPIEFAKLESEEKDSIVIQAFSNKKKYISSLVIKYDEELSDEKTKVAQIEKETLNDIKEIKCAALYSLTEYKWSVSSVVCQNIEYDIGTILSDEFDFDTFKDNLITLKSNNRGYPPTKAVDDIESVCEKQGHYFSRISYAKDGIEECKNKLKTHIESIEKKKLESQSYSIQQIIDEIGTAFLDESIRQNDLLVFMLRHGYLNETYNSYINNFHPTSITKDDMNFILGIRNHRSDFPFSFALENTQQIYSRLEESEFTQIEALNFDLVDYLIISEPTTPKTEAMVSQLSNHSSISMSFVKGYLDRGIHVDAFLSILCKYNELLWQDLLSFDGISNDTLYKILVELLKCVDVDQIIKLDVRDGNTGVLTKFLIDHEESMMMISSAPVDKQIDLLKGLDIKFVKLITDGLNPRIKETIFYESRYEINSEMISRIIEWKSPEYVNDLNTKNYTTIKKVGFKPLLDYINQHISDYVEKVTLYIETNTEEDKKSIIDLINLLIPSQMELCCSILNKENAIWTDFNDCVCMSKDFSRECKHQIWGALIEYNKVKCSWYNVSLYIEAFGIDANIALFIDEHIDEMNEDKSFICSEEMVNSIISSDISDATLEKIIKNQNLCPYSNDVEELSPSRIKLLIDNGLLTLSKNTWNTIIKIVPDYTSKYLIINKNDFMDALDEYQLTHETICDLLASEKFNENDKRMILSKVNLSSMDTTLAKAIGRLSFVVDKALSDSAWDYLDKDEKCRLLIAQISNYSNDELSSMLPQIGPEFKQFANRDKHKYTIANTPLYKQLFKKLYYCDYVTSCSEDPNDETILCGFVKEKRDI